MELFRLAKGPLYLIGLPGSGKSYFGALLAREYSCPFLDLDNLIAAQTGLNIPDLFSQFGEERFRQLESEVLRSVVPLTPFVMATGGGTPCFFDNMDWMNAQGTTVFLDLPLETIAARLIPEKHKRPLLASLKDAEILPFLRNLHAKRLPYYKKAKFTVDEHITGMLML